MDFAFSLLRLVFVKKGIDPCCVIVYTFGIVATIYLGSVYIEGSRIRWQKKKEEKKNYYINNYKNMSKYI